MEEQQMFSLEDLDQATACETPYEFELKDESDEPKGLAIFVSVIGAQAAVITDFIEKNAQTRRVEQAMAEKRDPRGKNPHVTPVRDDIAFANELAALRIVSWRGRIKEPYSHANALRMVSRSQSIREQVTIESENLGNFKLIVATS